jgi:hypothetical protein
LVDQGYYLTEVIFEKVFKKMLDEHKIPFRYMHLSDYDDPNFLSSRKVMFLMSRDYFPPTKQLLEFKYLKFEDPVKMSRNNLFDSSLSGFKFEKNFIFYGTFRDELQKLFEFGIIDELKGNFAEKIKKLSSSEQSIDVYESKKSEVVLSWDNLYAGFYLWIGACVISTIVFVGELVKNYFQR